MVQYCTTTDVSNELNGLTIDGSSTPSSTVVETWIEQESELLKKETKKLWGEETFTNEYHDYDGSGALFLLNTPVITVTKLEYEKAGLNNTEDWVELTEGRGANANFIVYKDSGEIYFHNTPKIPVGFQNVRVTYSAGAESVNPVVKMIVSKRVALRLIRTVINSQSSQEGGEIKVDVISLSDPSTFSLDSTRALKNDINELIPKLGTFKTFKQSRRWN